MAALPEPVRGLVSELIAGLNRRIEEQQKRIAILEEYRRLDALARFASKADRIAEINSAQLELLVLEPGLHQAEVDAALERPAAQVQAEAPAAEAMIKAKRYKEKAHPGREPLPAHLRREDILIDEPPAPLPCGPPPQELRRDTTERLAVIPAEYYAERITTVSYVFPGRPEEGVHRGAGPEGLLPKSSFAPGLVIDFLIQKYAGHMPVYRQVAALGRDHGINISYPSAGRAVIDAAALLIPVADAMLAELIAGDYIQADEPTNGRQAA